MKIFDAMQNFFDSIGEYVKNQSNLFWIFLGAFLLVSIVVIFITSFAYECMLTKTIDKINKFLERNPRINDDNLVAFNNMMKASSVPKTLRRQWQQFMLYREHPASYYMSFKHCVENPLRNSSYRQQMTVYKIVSYILMILSFVVSTFMAIQSYNANLVFQDIIIVPLTILVAYWLISMVLDLIHGAISADLFQNYQYFEINMDKAMLTLPEFVDYEVLFSQDEIRRGIPVLYAYLQKRAIQEQQELEKARLKNVDHEKFDFEEAGLDGSLVLDRAMRETENYTSQRKKYMQEIERVNNEIAVLENNYREQVKEYQRQVQTSKETLENLKEQLDQASSTIEINYIKKQMRDEMNRQQVAEKDFDIITDKHNQEIKSLNQEIKNYEEEIKKAKDAMETSMLSEFSTYSVKVYNNLEKIVDDKMQDRVDNYKDQIKDLESQLEEKNEELENVYTRYQEVLSQVPVEAEPVQEMYTELPTKKGKKKKKSTKEDTINEFGAQPAESNIETVSPVAEVEPVQEQYNQEPVSQYAEAQDVVEQPQEQYYDNYVDTNYTNDEYLYDTNYDQYPTDDQYATDYNTEYVPTQTEQAGDDQFDYNYNEQVPQYDYDQQYGYDTTNAEQDYVQTDDYNQDAYLDGQYVTGDGQYSTIDNQYSEQGNEYVPLEQSDEMYVPLGSEEQVYTPLSEDNYYTPSDNYQDYAETQDYNNVGVNTNFDDSDFDIDFNSSSPELDGSDFDSIFAPSEKPKTEDVPEEPEQPEEPVEQPKEVVELHPVDDDFDIDKILGLYDDADNSVVEELKPDVKPVVEEVKDEDTEDKDNTDEDEKQLPAPTEKRKAGRPRKVVDEDEEIKPKRKPGRPRKVVDEDEEVKPKRKPGRPRKKKVETEEVLEQPKRKAGRPRKNDKTESSKQPKRKAGRPRKDKQQTTSTAKRKPGRPRKNEQTLNKPKGKRGRPRKN